jgi:hypothetical protein
MRYYSEINNYQTQLLDEVVHLTPSKGLTIVAGLAPQNNTENNRDSKMEMVIYLNIVFHEAYEKL